MSEGKVLVEYGSLFPTRFATVGSFQVTDYEGNDITSEYICEKCGHGKSQVIGLKSSSLICTNCEYEVNYENRI